MTSRAYNQFSQKLSQCIVIVYSPPL